MNASEPFIRTPNRRRFLRGAGILGGMAATFPAWADTYIDLDLPGGPDKRELSTAFPQKAQMIVQRTRPPLLETPWVAYDQGVFTPNDHFFVRWHWGGDPGTRGRGRVQAHRSRSRHPDDLTVAR